jgi:hypothetical protein
MTALVSIAGKLAGLEQFGAALALHSLAAPSALLVHALLLLHVLSAVEGVGDYGRFGEVAQRFLKP